jgi:uncharacterized protein YdcH (DUF465 family)
MIIARADPPSLQRSARRFARFRNSHRTLKHECSNKQKREEKERGSESETEKKSKLSLGQEGSKALFKKETVLAGCLLLLVASPLAAPLPQSE